MIEIARKSKKRKTAAHGDDTGNNSRKTQTYKESQTTQTVLVDQSLSVARRPLPAAPPMTQNKHDVEKENDKQASIVLFYQYKESIWTESEFQRALKLFLAIGNRFSMTGRGRIAPEGVNCTLTSPSAIEVRGFCQALRDEWGVAENFSDKDLFKETDFKITDGLPQSKKFKSLSIRKTDELVAYGLEGEKAPSIEKFGGEHLTAVDYHEALKDKDTVVIDVRNAYETAIGTIVPPKGGATLLDPKLRNSREWPKWLASEETQKKLNGKKILTFCTGGIRCERATALINQMSAVSKSESASNVSAATTKEGGDDLTALKSLNSTDGSNQKVKRDASNQINSIDKDVKSFQPNGVYHMRGGIERYLKTYPQGGFWSGKNYLFDKRMEQLPELKASSQVEDEVAKNLNAKCCLCRKPWTSYRGQHKCDQIQCGVPVLVCDACHSSLTHSRGNVSKPPQLMCELCRDGYRAPQGNPDLVAMRKKAEKLKAGICTPKIPVNARDDGASEATTNPRYPPLKVVSDRLFLNRLPLSTKKSEIEKWLKTPIRQLHWVTDRDTGAYYGSCIVRIDVFSKILLSIKKQSRARGNATTTGKSSLNSSPLVARKTDQNAGEVREFLGPFPGTVTNHNAGINYGGSRSSHKRKIPLPKRRKRQQQQPKIFRVLARPREAWPPPNHNDQEYPPLGRIQ